MNKVIQFFAVMFPQWTEEKNEDKFGQQAKH